MTKNQIAKTITTDGNYKVAFTKANGKSRVMLFNSDSVELSETNAIVLDEGKGEIRSFRYDAVTALEKI